MKLRECFVQFCILRLSLEISSGRPGKAFDPRLGEHTGQKVYWQHKYTFSNFVHTDKSLCFVVRKVEIQKLWRKLHKVLFQIDLFIKIFTAIGREMVGSAKLTELICHLRDVFLWSQWLENDDMSRKKLLHLIELQSADWQLSSEAIAYYYPPNEKLSIAT